MMAGATKNSFSGLQKTVNRASVNRANSSIFFPNEYGGFFLLARADATCSEIYRSGAPGACLYEGLDGPDSHPMADGCTQRPVAHVRGPCL